MPSIRIGFSTDFNLVGEQVGIGTTNPAARLEVAGPILADNTSGGGGISTLTRYDGFLQPDQKVVNTVSIAETTKGNLNSLSGEIKIEGEVTVESGTTITGGRLDSLTATDRFAVPLGETNNRDNVPEPGTTRFNQDFRTLEFFDGVNWKTVNSYARLSGSGRGVFAGGYDFTNPGQDDRSTIEFIQISTLGNTSSFGDLLENKRVCSGCSSSTRGLNSGGLTPTALDVIEYVTIASGGNSIDFGNLTVARYALGALSSSTRGINGGGYHPSYKNELDYVEIATIGNALDFGDLSDSPYAPVGFSNGTRGIFAGGEVSLSPSNIKTGSMDSITIASKGNGVKFGDLTYGVYGAGGGSNSVRGIYAGGHNNGDKDEINFVTIASDGNGVDFGNLTIARRSVAGTSSQTRTVIAGGNISPVKVNTIDYITIASAGNAFDFGDLTRLIEQQSAFSDCHGGLGGF